MNMSYEYGHSNPQQNTGKPNLTIYEEDRRPTIHQVGFIPGMQERN